MGFFAELQALIAKYQAKAAEIAPHMNAHAQAVQNAADQGHSYVVFPDQNDPNYGNPMGGSTNDDTSTDDGA